jgi:Flp pilus assembly protein CpaB
MATRRRGRALIFVAVILILLLVLAFAAYQILLPTLMPTPEPTPDIPLFTPTPEVVTVDIVMTTQLIPRGGTITEDVVSLVSMPKQDYVEGSFYLDLEEVVGRRARFDLRPLTPLTEALTVGDEGNIAAFQIPRGMVAISIPVSKLSSVSYGLQPGDHVNVIASLMLVDIDPSFQTILANETTGVTLPGRLADQFTGVAVIDAGTAGRGEYDPTLGTPIYVYPSEDQRPRLVSQTLIQDTIVLQMGIFAQSVPEQASAAPPAPDPNADPAAEPAPAPADETFIPVPDVVTLIVSPQDAVTLNYLMLAGAKLNLVMRSAGDFDMVNTEAVTLQFVLDQYGIPNPAKLPYGMLQRADTIINPETNTIPPFPQAGDPEFSLPTATPVAP